MSNEFFPCTITYAIIDDGHTPDAIKGINIAPMPPNKVDGEKTQITVLSTLVTNSNHSGALGYVSCKKGNLNLVKSGKKLIKSHRMIFSMQGTLMPQQTVSIDFYTVPQTAKEPLNGILKMMVRNGIHGGESPVALEKEQSIDILATPGAAVLTQPLLAVQGANGISEEQLKMVHKGYGVISQFAFEIYLENIALNADFQVENPAQTWFNGIEALSRMAPHLLSQFLS